MYAHSSLADAGGGASTAQPYCSTLEPVAAAPSAHVGHDAPIPYSSAPYDNREYKEVVGASGGDGSDATPGRDPHGNRPWFRQKRWIVGLAIAAAVLVALLVGLPVGLTRKGAGTAPASPNDTETTTSICVKGPLCRAVLAAVSFGTPASIFVFALGEKRSVFYRRGDGVSTWTSDWTSLGGEFASPPAAVEFTYFGNSTLGLFALGSPFQNLLARFFRNGELSPSWENLNVPGSRSHIGLCRVTPPGSAHVWVTNGPDNNLTLYHKYWNTDPNTLPSPAWRDDVDYWPRFREVAPASAVGIACRIDPMYHDVVVYTQQNGSVTHTQFVSPLTGQWSPWNNRGGSFIGDPVLVSVGNDRVDFFGIGIDKAMYHYVSTTGGGFSALDSLGGSFASIPSVVASRDGGRLDVVALGRDGHLKHRAMKGSIWGRDWEDLGVAGNSAPLAVNVDSSPPHVAIFVIGEKGDLMFTSWTVSDDMSWTGLPPWTSIGGNFSVNYDDGLLPVNAVGL